MITIFVDEYNQISQDYYDAVINGLQFHQLTCSCGHSACLKIHAYYIRGVCFEDHVLPLRVCRVKCSECGCTHTLLLSSLVPYSRISTSDQHAIISAYETASDPRCICEANLSIDENNIKSVIRRWRLFWKQRLLSERIKICDLISLIQSCFSYYSMQFMQVRYTHNQLFPNTT